jgi:hypothetical protein
MCSADVALWSSHPDTMEMGTRAVAMSAAYTHGLNCSAQPPAIATHQQLRAALWPHVDLCSLPSQVSMFQKAGAPGSPMCARQPTISAGVPGMLKRPTLLQAHTGAGCSTAPRSHCRCSCRHGTGASSGGRAWFTTRPSGSGWSVKRTARPASTGHQLRWPPTAAASAARPPRAAAEPSPATTGAQPLRCRPAVKQPGRIQLCTPLADTADTADV